MSEVDSQEKDLVPAVSRASAILDLVAYGDGTALSVADIAKSLGLARSSTANLCTALRDLGFLRAVGGHYVLGHKLLELGAKYLSTVDQVQLFYDLCEDTQLLCSETARLALLDGMSVIYLARYDGTQPLRLTAGIGDRFPASITATGKAILSTYSDEDLDARLQGVVTLPTFTEKSIATVDGLKRELEETRRRGYALDDEETTMDVLCISIPVIFPEDKRCSMAVSVTVHKSRDSLDFREAMVKDLRRVEEGMVSVMKPHVRTKSRIDA